MNSAPKSVWQQLNRGWRYWTGAALTLLAGMLASALVDRYASTSKVRYQFFQWLVELDPRDIQERYVKRVMVGDEEYWRGPLAGRRPIKRDYLAKLLAAVDTGKPLIIAMDFDLRLPDPERLSIPEDYREESEILARAVLQIAEDREIVLPANVSFAKGGGYAMDPSLFQVFGICSRVAKDGTWTHEGTPALPISANARRNIRCGYIELPPDMRSLPPVLSLDNGGELDSFSLAITRLRSPDAARSLGHTMRYASFVRSEDPNQPAALDLKSRRQFSASEVLGGDIDLKEALAGAIVIVGGSWSPLAAGRGKTPVDSKVTPVGSIPGARVHSNYVEALLDSRTYPAVPHRVIMWCEAAFGILASLLFALCTTVWRQLGSVVALTIALLVIQWALINFLGIVFEALLLVISVWLHSFLEPWAEKLFGEEHSKHSEGATS